MTLDRVSKAITTGSLFLVGMLLPIQYFVVLRHIPQPLVRWLAMGVLSFVAFTLFITFALAPRAVRITTGQLIVERMWWFDYAVPLREVIGVEEGPPLKVFGKVRRVAGNGGLMGFTGLFHVANVGLVRCWATRLGEPTVLVRRAHEKPILLGVDDSAGLLRALRRAGQ